MLPYRILLGFVAAVTFLGAYAGPAVATDADGYPQNTFTAQFRAVGLTAGQARSLQADVDALVAAKGGTQIAANRVRWADGGGDTTLPLPGEARARSLTAAGSMTAAGGVFGCDYLYFCTFEKQHYQGQMYRYYYCQDHWTGYSFNSYENNQTGHTRAVLKYHDHSIIHTTPGAWTSHPTFSGLFTYYIKPC